jgi:hypothetical protein
MSNSYPPHVDAEVAQMGYDEFASRAHDDLRWYLRTLQDSQYDFSQTLMNIQVKDLPQLNEDEGKVPRLPGHLTISEYIDYIAERDGGIPDEFEEFTHLEDAFTSWQAGALRALKK